MHTQTTKSYISGKFFFPSKADTSFCMMNQRPVFVGEICFSKANMARVMNAFLFSLVFDCTYMLIVCGTVCMQKLEEWMSRAWGPYC